MFWSAFLTLIEHRARCKNSFRCFPSLIGERTYTHLSFFGCSVQLGCFIVLSY